MINPNRKPIRRKKSYDLWANAMSRKFGISRDEFNAHPYDYAQYYKDNYDEAWEHVNNKLAPYLHFPDRYKTAQHPTFSDESKHSGKFGIYNTSGIRGGSWSGDDKYIFSEDLINYKWPIDKTAEYVSQEGVKLYTPYGKQILPKYSGGKDDDTYDDIWFNGNRYTYDQNALRYVNSDYLPVLFAQGGMLPEVTVVPSIRQRLDHPLLFNQLNVARMTPEQKEIYYKAKLGFGSDKLAEFAGEMTPVGDATDVYRIGQDVSNGNLLPAAAGVGLLFLPNFIEKPLRKLGKLKRVFSSKKAEDLYKSEKSSIKIIEENASSITPEQWSTDDAQAVFLQEWNDALNYAKSKERERVFKKMLHDAKKDGYISGDANDFLLPIRDYYPTVVIENKVWKPGTLGNYNKFLHRVKLLDPVSHGGIDNFRGSSYHEALHSVGVGDNYRLTYHQESEYHRIGEEILALALRLNSGQELSPEEYSKLLALLDLLTAIAKEYEGLNRFARDKTNRVLSYSYKGDYLRDPAELVVNGLEFGKKHGISLHAPYPGENAFINFHSNNYADIANRRLNYIKLENGVSDKYGKDFWDIITGKFLPTAVPLGVVGASRLGGKDEK